MGWRKLVAGRRLGFVQAQEIGLVHEHFAADFDQAGRLAVQPFRQGLQCAQIRCHVLAFGAVAAGGAAHEATVFVGERYRQAVDFRLADERQGAIGAGPGSGARGR